MAEINNEEKTVTFTIELKRNKKVAGMIVELRNAYVNYNDKGEIEEFNWGDGLFLPNNTISIRDANESLFNHIEDEFGDEIDDRLVEQFEKKYPRNNEVSNG